MELSYTKELSDKAARSSKHLRIQNRNINKMVSALCSLRTPVVEVGRHLDRNAATARDNYSSEELKRL
jgi:predicted trehalose synthase